MIHVGRADEAPEFPEAAKAALANHQLRANVRRATDVIRARFDGPLTPAEWHELRGYAAHKTGDAARAVTEIQKALDLDPRNQTYVLELSEVLHLDFCVLPPAEAARPLWRPFSAGAVGATGAAGPAGAAGSSGVVWLPSTSSRKFQLGSASGQSAAWARCQTSDHSPTWTG